MYNGIINIYKEKGFTSHDVVAKLRGILKQKKIGHTGTLDPDAVGVLPVCLGQGTKLCDMLTEKTKAYEAVFCLGYETDTQDASGEVVNRYDGKMPLEELSQEKVCEVIESFVGKMDQLPPMYSAIKINGKKLYELAREGKEVERKTRPIEIFSIEILSLELPKIKIRVSCSKGTYIRTLCYDIGRALGTYACMEELKRIQSGQFTLDTALRLQEVEALVMKGEVDAHILPLEQVFMDYPRTSVKKETEMLLRNGNPLSLKAVKEAWQPQQIEGSFFRVCDSNGVFQAIYQYKKERNMLIPQKMFLTDTMEKK